MPTTTRDGAGPLAGLGPFFALETLPQGDDGWVSVKDFVADHNARVEQYAETLGCPAAEVDRRAAASVLQLAVAARVVSPWIGLAAVGHLLAPTAADLWCVPDPAPSALRLAIDPSSMTQQPDVATWAQTLTTGMLAPLVGAVQGSSVTLWGNVVSAINGAVTVIQAVHPERAAAARETAARLVARLPVQRPHTGTLGTSTFRRRSCCQLYRLTAGSDRVVCQDCVLPAR